MSPSDKARFEALYRASYGAVLRFAARRTDRGMAEEVAAETFAVAWRRLDRVPASDPLPWLYVVARNELANRRRAAARDHEKLASAGAVLEQRGRDPADALAERDSVLGAFARLSEPDRQALRLVAWENLSLAAAARVAGTSGLPSRCASHARGGASAPPSQTLTATPHCPHELRRPDDDPRHARPAARY